MIELLPVSFGWRQNAKLSFLSQSVKFFSVRRFASLLAAALLLGQSAHGANTSSWTGGSGGDWSTPGNWSGTDTPPAAADTALFNTGAGTSITVTNTSTSSVTSISFDTSAGSYTLGATSGGAFNLGSGGTIQILSTLNSSNAVETINAPIILSGNYTFANNSASGTGVGAGTLKFGGTITSAVTSGTTTLTLGGSNANANTISGIISNGGGTNVVAINDLGTWVLSGNNTFGGGVTVGASGTLNINASGASSTNSAIGTGTLVIGLGGKIDNTSGSAVVLATNNAVSFTSFTFGGSNNLNLGSGNASYTSNTGTITLNGTNSVLALGRLANTYSAASNIALTVNGSNNTLVVGGYDLSSGAAGKSLTIDGSANINITGAVTDSSSTGTGSTLTYIGTGKLTLSGTDTYTGKTTIGVNASTTASTLQFAKEASFYNGNTASWNTTNLRVNSAATLALNVGGAGEFTASDVATIVALSASTGGFLAGSSIGLDTTNAAGGTFVYSGNITNAHSIGLTKLGAGNLQLTSATGSTYSGGTVVKSGGLLVTNTSGSATGTGALTVNSGAMIGGSGKIASTTNTINGSVQVGNGGADTTSILTMTASTSTTFSGANLTFNLSTTTNGQSTQLALGASPSVLFSNTSLTFNLQGTGAVTDGTYILFTSTTSGSGDGGSIFSGLDLTGDVINGIHINSFPGSQLLLLSNGTGGYNIELELESVPEPGTWALMVGSLALLGVFQRRRREF